MKTFNLIKKLISCFVILVFSVGCGTEFGTLYGPEAHGGELKSKREARKGKKNTNAVSILEGS
ncbi:MAG: hypothetical protein QGI45_12865, partial [Myxococcota bacterium]|nr:hypothetical protein [Myxococcota bacterium]